MSLASPANWSGWSEALRNGPEATLSRRRRALDNFLLRGFPGPKAERWKYTRSDALAGFTQQWLALEHQSIDAATAKQALAVYLREQALREDRVLGFFNGQLVHNGLDEAKTGIRLSEGAADDSESADDELSLLNSALANTELSLAVHKIESDADPIHLVHLSTANAPVLASPRLTLNVGENACAKIVEHFPGPTAPAQVFTNARLIIRLSENAKVSHFRVQDGGESSLNVRQLDVDAAAGAHFSSTSLDTGSDLTRNEVTVRLNGAGASCDIVGVYLVNTRQHIDNHIHVDHLAKDTRSSQEFVGIAGGHARAIFNSKVHVHPGADGTDATQTNRNLLLSNQAEVDTKPELEIYADDVKCSHGATTGQLDEAALFYLKSRGLGEQAARELLVYAFVEATLSQIGEESLHRMYERVVKTALGSLLKDNPLQ